MYLYLFTYVVGALAAFFVRGRRPAVLLASFAAVLLLVFVGGRYEVGCDYLAYQMRFDFLYPSTVGWVEAFEMGEGAFHSLNLLARDFGWGFNGVIMLAALVSVGCLYRFSLLASNPLSLMVTAFPILVVQLGMSGIRQSLALSVLMLAFVAFTERKRVWTAIWILIAFLFHSSAIVMLPIALLARKSINTRYVALAVLLISPFAAWLLGERLDVYSDRYVEQIYGENSSNGAWFRYAAAALPFALIAWKRKLVEAAFPQLFPIIWLFSLAVAALIVVGLISSVALHRLTFYVMPVSLLALQCVTESAFRKDNRSSARALPLVIYGLYFFGWFLSSRHAVSCYIPYQSWLL